MGRAIICVCLVAACLPLAGEPGLDRKEVTVVFDFKGRHSNTSFEEMRREAADIIETAGMRLAWRSRTEAAGKSFRDLVVMTFKGACEFQRVPAPYDELGPYAVTLTSGGEVQPFGEIDCDRVSSSIRSAMWGGDFAQADRLMGRALGRVVAHELIHMITRSGQHADEGVHKSTLSGKQLIAARLR